PRPAPAGRQAPVARSTCPAAARCGRSPRERPRAVPGWAEPCVVTRLSRAIVTVRLPGATHWECDAGTADLDGGPPFDARPPAGRLLKQTGPALRKDRRVNRRWPDRPTAAKGSAPPP